VKANELQQTFTAVIKQDGDWWIGWVEEGPGANAQESTREALVESLGGAGGSPEHEPARGTAGSGVATRSWL